MWSSAEANECGRVRLADELGEHRIELRRRRIAQIAARIDSHARTGRLLVCGQHAGAARDDARLHRKAARRFDRGLIGDPQSFQRLAGRDAKLRLDQVDARDLLGHGVLDLDARIALDEKMLAALGADQKLDRARIHVAGRARESDRVVQDASAEGRPRVPAPARSRPPSDCEAGPNSRARRDERCCRGCQRGSGPRCDAGARPASRQTPSRRRTPPVPRSGIARMPPPSHRRSATARMPRPPPPAAAFSMTG